VFILGLAMCVTVDALMGLTYRTNTNASIALTLPRSRTTHRAIVVFPGYIMPGELLSKAFAPYIGANDGMVVVVYAERGVSVSQISAQIMAALDRLGPVELRVYGASMGGMVGKGFLDRYRATGMPYGKVTLVLDSAPASRDDVKRPSFLFDVSCRYRGGPLSTVGLAIFNACVRKPPAPYDTPQELVCDARRTGAWVGMPAATSQACFIASFGTLRKDELVDVAEQVVFLQGYSPEADPVVSISEAIDGWRVAFPNLVVITLPGRNGRLHLPLLEYPRETVHALTANRIGREKAM
jgi:pimeloyl-ACP methyl ester carboxylesterase